jgi:nucleoside-diphosphate-sugar epimerase
MHPGPRAMRAMTVAMAAVGRVVTLSPALTPEALRVLAGTTYFGSNEKAVRELGYSPRPLEEGMAQTLEHELRLLGRS